MKFLKPVFFGDTITATYWITEVNEARRKTTGQCVMTNQRGETVLTCLHYMKVIDPVGGGEGTMNKWQKAYLRGAYRGKSPGAFYPRAPGHGPGCPGLDRRRGLPDLVHPRQ